jgi:hypothetical protein
LEARVIQIRGGNRAAVRESIFHAVRISYLDYLRMLRPWLNDPITLQQGMLLAHIDAGLEIGDMIYSRRWV